MTEYRAEQVGSLLRPMELRDARTAYLDGRLDRDALTEIEDRAILDVLEAQRRCGVDVYTDGELRRTAYLLVLADALDGFSAGGGRTLPWRGRPGQEIPPDVANFSLPVVTERLHPRERIAGREAAFMRAHAPGPYKITLPSPVHFSTGSYLPGVSDRVYPRAQDLSEHVTAILAEEAATLAVEGTPYIQVDSPTYSTFVDASSRERMGQGGVDLDGAVEGAIQTDNVILDAARSGGAMTGVHVCRGNDQGFWLADGGYEPIAERAFAELRCDRLLLEYDSERAGGFEPLRFVPEDKTVVLGLVTTKSPRLEERDDLLRRIEEASRYVPLERLALSPQCGFASDFHGNPLSEDDQWRKLELVVSVASEVWT